MKILIFFSPLFLISCANTESSRLLAGSLAGASGAVLGHEFGDGKPAWIAAGAGAGVLASEAIQHSSKKKAQASYDQGYDKGRSDAVKQQYWMMVDAQKGSPEDTSFSFYEIPIPGMTSAGATLLPSMQTIRLQD